MLTYFGKQKELKPMMLELTAKEAEALKNLLVEEASRMDDDGNEGAFDASILKTIYRKLRAAK